MIFFEIGSIGGEVGWRGDGNCEKGFGEFLELGWGKFEGYGYLGGG